MKAEDLLGTWTLEHYEINFPDERPALYPFGENPKGMLIYAEDGYMSAILSYSDRSKLSSTTMEESRKVPEAEKAEAFDTYMNYAGTYRLEGNEVIHSVHLALDPNVPGTELTRTAKLENGQLILFFDKTSSSGRTVSYQLIWQRPDGIQSAPVN